MSRLLLDLRVAARTLVRSRFVSALAIVAFALGIGVTTAVFSIFNGVLLRPLPYPQPEQLVMVYDTQPACSTCPASFPKYTDWKTRNEGVLLALTGGVLGLAVAQWILRTFFVLAGNQLPRATSIAIDGRVLAFTALVSLAVGIFCGLWPLVLLRTRELAAAVREGDLRTGSGAGRRVGNGLVVVFVGTAAAVLFVAMLASYLPARSAGRVDPMIVLRDS